MFITFEGINCVSSVKQELWYDTHGSICQNESRAPSIGDTDGCQRCKKPTLEQDISSVSYTLLVLLVICEFSILTLMIINDKLICISYELKQYKVKQI